jgi:hypothetical protein
MHSWGDDFPYFREVGEAADYIGLFLIRWGRVNVRQTKEKWGMACVYCDFGWHQLHSITHPGYAFCQYPKWLWHLDIDVLSNAVSRLNFIVVPFHKWLYRIAYKRAVQKFPYIQEEILRGADWSELLEGLYRAKQ